MADTKTKTKFYWTNLRSNKDGKVKDGKITVKAEAATHVWVKVEAEGAGRQNAPFYFRKVTGDFEASVKVTSTMENWLDAAGLLLKEKRGVYTKVALEYHDDPLKPGNHNYYAAAYVHTEDQLEMYDNVTPYPGQYKLKDKKYDFVKLDKDPKEKVKIWFKVTRKGPKIDAQYSLDGTEWMELRKSKFTRAKSLSVGIFAAAGMGDTKGVKATIEDLKIEEDPDWVDKPDWEVDFAAEAEEVVEDADKKLEFVDLERKAAEEEEAMMMARLSALQAGMSGDADAATGDLLEDDSDANFDVTELDLSAQMRQINALRNSIVADEGGSDDESN